MSAAPADVRPAWRAWVLAGIVFLGGAGVGVGGTAAWFGTRLAPWSLEPDELAERISADLAEDFDLDSAARERARAILRRRHERLRDVREELRARVQPEFEALDQEMAELLGPQKAARWHERLERSRRRWDRGSRKRSR